MTTRIFRAITEPIRKNISWNEQWDREDQGLIACWERGREKSKEEPDLASLACNGELVVLPWKGGIGMPLKNKKKYGSLRYLAMWQGLRGENLDMNIISDTLVVCSRTKTEVTFTRDQTKIAES